MLSYFHRPLSSDWPSLPRLGGQMDDSPKLRHRSFVKLQSIENTQEHLVRLARNIVYN